jgi:hypothetical protein
LVVAVAAGLAPAAARGGVTREEVERAIKDGLSFLKSKQNADGSWNDVDPQSHGGTTALVTLALLTAGEKPDGPAVSKALEYLRRFRAEDLGRVYSVALQTMAFSAALPLGRDKDKDLVRITANVYWLERAQVKPGDGRGWAGSWTYDAEKRTPGDNSNSQYALLALNAASEVGVKVDAETWVLARRYWEQAQRGDGGFAYQPDAPNPATASMTCAGVSSLIISGLKRYQGQETIVGERIHDCGKGGANLHVEAGIDWLATHFHVGQNFPRSNGQWKYYYLYGLERTGRLAGVRFFGDHDWYREGAEMFVHDQKAFGPWIGSDAYESDPVLATSFALLFLAKGRTPVVINKVRHGPGEDWDNDHDDVRNLVDLVGRDWKHLLTWQTVDPEVAEVEDMLQAPIAFMNGHRAPHLTAEARRTLREYVEQGGFLFAEACCGEPEFDRGFRALMREMFPEEEYKLHPLPREHPVWRARFDLSPDVHPLWGIEHGCRTVVIYSPADLSCFWNQMEAQPSNVAVVKASKVGQNVVDYATGRELPADKLTVREVKNFKVEATARRGALYIAKLKHGGDWNVAPLAIPSLTTMLKERRGFDVVVNHKEILARDPNLIHYPLLYIHGRAGLSFAPEDMAALRRHLEPGGGVIFADAACGSPAFDASFRKFVAELLPNNPLVPIPRDDELYTDKVGFSLADVQYTKAAGGGKGLPQLEGVKVDGHWAVIYSKYDIGCALERQQGLDCKGYAHESALRIAANIVIYATLP